MNKLIDGHGNLTLEGERFLLDFRSALRSTMGSDEVRGMNENELRVLGSCLQSLVGEAVSNHMNKKESVSSQLEAMSDEEFEGYLSEKYGPGWALMPLTPEEYKRVPVKFPNLEELRKEMQETGQKLLQYVTRNGFRR